MNYKNELQSKINGIVILKNGPTIFDFEGKTRLANQDFIREIDLHIERFQFWRDMPDIFFRKLFEVVKKA